MAIYALSAGTVVPLMEVVAGLIIGLRGMTSSTELITLSHRLQAMRIVTVAAGHPSLIHFALDK
jgi:hypothetical protein